MAKSYKRYIYLGQGEYRKVYRTDLALLAYIYLRRERLKSMTMSAKEIARHIHCHPKSVTAICRRLEADGYIRIKQSMQPSGAPGANRFTLTNKALHLIALIRIGMGEMRDDPTVGRKAIWRS